MNIRSEEAFGLTVAIIAIVFVLFLAGSGLNVLDHKITDSRIEELSRSAAKTGLASAIDGIQTAAGSATWNDPVWAAFFQDTDINGDGIIARDGEVDANRDGEFEISIVSKGISLTGRNGIDDDGDGIIDDLPGVSGIPEIAPTQEDVNGNRRYDPPDGILEDAFGIVLRDGYGDVINEDVGSDGISSYPYNVPPGHPLYGVYEAGYDPVDNPDPGEDDYHPLWNPTGTEGNGRFDASEPFSDTNGNGIRDPGEPFTDVNMNGIFDGETDFNYNGRLDTVEYGLQKWLRHWKRIPMGTSLPGFGGKTKDYFGNLYVRVLDAGSKINLNGPDVLTALLINNLLKAVELVPKAFDTPLTPVDESLPEYDDLATSYIDERGDGRDSDGDSITDDGTLLGFNSRGMEYDCDLHATIINDPLVNQKNNVGTTTAMADDADAVLIIKYRNSLPGRRFQSVDQLLEVTRPGSSVPPACAAPDHRPLLARKAGRIFDRENVNRDPVQTGDQAVYIDNMDEFERLKDFVTVEGRKDTTAVKPDPLNPVNLLAEPVYPVNLNAASKEVLHTVLATGITVVDTAAFSAAGKLADEMIAHRLQNPFKGWNEFEVFMDNTIGTDTANTVKFLLPEGIVLFREKKGLIAQLVPNTRLQGFNPDKIFIRSLDKTHIGVPTTGLSPGYSGYFEIDSLGIITSTAASGIDDEIISLLYTGTTGSTTTSGELGRKDIRAFVKALDILRHTTQTDFEHSGTSTASKSRYAKSLYEAASYPENIRDAGLGMGPSTSSDIPFVPTAIGVDEATGDVYVGGNNTIQVWRYNKNTVPALSPVGTATLSGTSITFLLVDRPLPSAGIGRLYAGVSNSDTIRVFDIMSTATSGSVDLQPRVDIEGIPGVFPKKVALDPGRKVITALSENDTSILEWRYPPADVHAVPEIDNLNTTSTDESMDSYDDDNDGLPDDPGTSTRGRPETLIDHADSDDDGAVDDSARPKPTQPKHPASLSKTPYTIDTGFSSPPVDIAFDSGLGQFFVAGENTVAGYRDGVSSHILEVKISSTLSPSFSARAMAVDSDSGSLYILGDDSGDTLIRLSTSGIPTAFYKSDELPFGGALSNASFMVMDEEDDVIFVLNEGAVGTVTAVNAGNERLRIMPVSEIGMGNISDAKALGIDSRRNRVYIAEGSSQKLKMFEYRVGSPATKRQTWADGYIMLAHNSTPRGTTTQMLYRSDFQGDTNLMGIDTANQFGTGTPVLTGTGTPLLIVNGDTEVVNRSDSVFVADKGTVTVRLAPDGILTQTLSDPGIVSGGIVSYEPEVLFGNGTITADVDGRGIRYGAVEFWIKFPRVTSPWAVPEANITNGKDDDGDGTIDDTGSDPAANPETDITNGKDDDGDGYVDDTIGIGNDNKPGEIVLWRLFYEVPVENDIFVTKNNGVSSREDQLEMIMGTSEEIDSFSFDDPNGTYTVFSKLSLKDFQDTNNDNLIDTAMLELERLSFPGTVTVSGLYVLGGGFNNEPVYPGAETYTAGTATVTLEPGVWRNIACIWWINTNGSNREEIKQNLWIDSTLISCNSVDLGTDTSYLPGTVSARLSDLNSGTAAPVFHLGTKIFEVGTETSFLATIDDLVIYNGTSSVAGSPKRFVSSFGTSAFERGESYQDYNGNFQRDASGHAFADKNHNGIFDVGESFNMGSATFYDSSGEFYSFYGERFIDAGTGTANEYDPGEQYVDYNRNGIWDAGEFYLDVNLDGNYNPGVPVAGADANRDLRLDDSGYIVRNFQEVLPRGTRIGTIGWTEYVPEGGDVSFELVLRALDGKVLWRWFGGDGTSTSIRIDLDVTEDAVLEYRANLFTVGTQTESPVIDDVTVTVIRKKPEMISYEEK
ncbi:MAG: hypothetical protein E3K32_05235 [wastewater metagenome]|nr:hypothetical protein [Candidatus Loosdrechtia aerotolerans]